MYDLRKCLMQLFDSVFKFFNTIFTIIRHVFNIFVSESKDSDL